MHFFKFVLCWLRYRDTFLVVRDSPSHLRVTSSWASLMSKQARKVAEFGTIHVKIDNKLLPTNNLNTCNTVLINQSNTYTYERLSNAFEKSCANKCTGFEKFNCRFLLKQTKLSISTEVSVALKQIIGMACRQRNRHF